MLSGTTQGSGGVSEQLATRLPTKRILVGLSILCSTSLRIRGGRWVGGWVVWVGGEHAYERRGRE